MHQIIIPNDEEHWLNLRKTVITSTECASLFNQGWISYEKLLNNKKNKTSSDFKENERMIWGRYLQQGIAEKFANDNGWDLRKMNEFILDDEIGIGASYDYEISYESQTPKGECFLQKAILEIKNISYESYKKEWIEGFEIQAPIVYELQLQHEMLVGEYEVGFLATLIGGCKGILLKREANKKVQEAILNKTSEFWSRIDKDRL